MNKKVLINLFLSTLYLSAFTFGGGYVIVTLMKNKFVDECHWIEEDEMLDLVAIAQSAPGAIAVNGAIVVGYKLAGIIGVLVATVATVIPPFIIISVISVFYTLFRENRFIAYILDGMQAGVGAVIASVSIQMCFDIVKANRISSIIMATVFVLSLYFKINIIYINSYSELILIKLKILFKLIKKNVIGKIYLKYRVWYI